MEATTRDAAALAPASNWRLISRVFLVVVISIFYIGTTLPDVVTPWHPMGHFGFAVDVNGNVVEVDPGTPAARAGVRTGDRMNFAATPVESRRYQYGGIPDVAEPGSHAVFAFDRGTTRLTIPLVARAGRLSFADDVSEILLVLSEVVPALAGAWLLLQRPSRMTWAFFLYTTGTPLLCTTAIALVPTNGIVGLYVFEAPIAFQSLWLFIFALRFPNDAATGWRAYAERATLVALVPLIPLNLWDLDGALVGVPPPPAVVALIASIGVWGLVAAALTFLVTYVHSKKGDRARVRWVMLGLVVGYSGQLGFNFVVQFFPNAFTLPSWAYDLTASTQIFVAITVAYAVIRHRVFDVRFFIARAVVYGTLTSIVVAFLSLVDLVAGKLLSGTGLAAIGEVGLAVVVGLGLDGVHKRVESFVDSRLFRSRIEAQARLRSVARGLTNASTIEEVERQIVHEPAAAFRLTSVASFRRVDSGAFARRESIGWESGTMETIDADHVLALRLRETSEAVPIHPRSFPADAFPAGDHRPALAIPIVVRSILETIVFYGPHANQEDLDPAEVESLDRLLADASAAFDHVRAEMAAKRVSELEAEVARLLAMRAVS